MIGFIFSLIDGVVDIENDFSFTWFFEQFKNTFGKSEKICVVLHKN